MACQKRNANKSIPLAVFDSLTDGDMEREREREVPTNPFKHELFLIGTRVVWLEGSFEYSEPSDGAGCRKFVSA